MTTRTELETLAVALYESNARATAKRSEGTEILRIWTGWKPWHETAPKERTRWRLIAASLQSEPLP